MWHVGKQENQGLSARQQTTENRLAALRVVDHADESRSGGRNTVNGRESTKTLARFLVFLLDGLDRSGPGAAIRNQGRLDLDGYTLITAGTVLRSRALARGRIARSSGRQLATDSGTEAVKA